MQNRTSKNTFVQRFAYFVLACFAGIVLFCAQQTAQELQVLQKIDLPKIEMTLKDIVDISIEYTIIHETNPVFCREFYGLTDFDTKTISICDKADTTLQRITFLHECFHIMYWKLGIVTSESYEVLIDEKAREAFQRLYGLPSK